MRKDAMHVLHTGPHTHAHTHTHTHTHAHTHTRLAAEGDIYVFLALLKSLVSVKLNLGIIITSETAESYFSRLASAPPHILRDTEEGSGHTVRWDQYMMDSSWETAASGDGGGGGGGGG